MPDHRTLEERSRVLHGRVADKLKADGRVLSAARNRVDRWLEDGSVHPRYAEAWKDLLAEGPEVIARRLTEASEEMDALRQCSPFAGALDARERWAILRELRSSAS